MNAVVYIGQVREIISLVDRGQLDDAQAHAALLELGTAAPAQQAELEAKAAEPVEDNFATRRRRRRREENPIPEPVEEPTPEPEVASTDEPAAPEPVSEPTQDLVEGNNVLDTTSRGRE